jgi:hypothetical protein
MPKTMSTATEADVTGMPKAASGVNCRSASVTTLGSFGCVSQIGTMMGPVVTLPPQLQIEPQKGPP